VIPKVLSDRFGHVVPEPCKASCWLSKSKPIQPGLVRSAVPCLITRCESTLDPLEIK
jgi:hypothetical protein